MLTVHIAFFPFLIIRETLNTVMRIASDVVRSIQKMLPVDISLCKKYKFINSSYASAKGTDFGFYLCCRCCWLLLSVMENRSVKSFRPVINVSTSTAQAVLGDATKIQHITIF